MRTFAHDDFVLAVRLRHHGNDFDYLIRAMRLVDLQEEAEQRALLLGHEIRRWIRHNYPRAIARCIACDARLYVELAEPPIMEGEVFEVACDTR